MTMPRTCPYITLAVEQLLKPQLTPVFLQVATRSLETGNCDTGLREAILIKNASEEEGFRVRAFKTSLSRVVCFTLFTTTFSCGILQKSVIIFSRISCFSFYTLICRKETTFQMRTITKLNCKQSIDQHCQSTCIGLP